MNRVDRNWIVGILVGGGPIVAGLSNAQVSVEVYFGELIPEVVWISLPVVGVLMLLAGIVLWFSIRIRIPALMPNYEGYRAKESELKTIHDFATNFFGSDVSPLRRMTQWYRKNPEIFKVIYKVKRNHNGNSKKFVGYYCIMPISLEAIEKLKSKEITGADFQPEHILSIKENPPAIYVGAIAASGLLAQGNTRSILHNDISNYWAPKTRAIYTRPITEKGLELIEEYGFTSVDPQSAGKKDELYVKELHAA